MFEDSVAASIPSIWASMNSWFTPAVLFVLLNVVIGTIAFTSTLTNQNKHHHPQEHTQNNHQNQNKLINRSPSLLQRVRSINFYSYRSQESNLFTTTTTTNNHTDTSTNTTATHYNLSPDEHTHESETLDNPTHYIFEQPHQPTDDTHTQYPLFQQNPEQNGQETNTQFFFDQNHEQNGQETDNHFKFELGNGQKFEKVAEEDEEEEENDEIQSLDEVYSKLKGGHVSRTTSDTKPASGEVPKKLPKKMKKSASSKSAFSHFKADDVVEARRPATVRERGVAKVTEADDGVDAKADDFINKFKQQLKLQRIDSIIRYKDMITRGSEK